ncbi:hypothetical protein ABZW10_29070 [Kitasatospora sp. NPDC004723]|uniref:hypothetical protein n=1 Tax=Kitasatospora sp. NPDC004723 TaxID=3154288 RepID=UPI0033B86543
MPARNEEGRRSDAAPGLAWFLAAPPLAVASTLLGTRLTAQTWDGQCEFGIGPSDRFALVLITMPTVCCAMVVALVLLQLALRRAPAGVRWPALVGTAVLFTALYTAGMGRPPTAPQVCAGPWPTLPFTR